MGKLLFDSLRHKLVTGLSLAAIEYDGQLSATAYIMLSAVSLGIIAGLGWCFYRAVKATDSSAEPQLPDEVGDQ